MNVTPYKEADYNGIFNIKRVEKLMIQTALKKYTIKTSAEKLGVSEKTLHTLIKRHEIKKEILFS